jgi:transposase
LNGDIGGVGAARLEMAGQRRGCRRIRGSSRLKPEDVDVVGVEAETARRHGDGDEERGGGVREGRYEGALAAAIVEHTPHGRAVLPEHLPVVTLVLTPTPLPENATKIREEVSFRLGFRRAGFYRLKVVRPVYSVGADDAAACDGTKAELVEGEVPSTPTPVTNASDAAEHVDATSHDAPMPTTVAADERTVICAPAPHEMIERGLPSADLLAHVVTGKFAHNVTYHRQEGMLARSGVHIARGVMCTWTERCHGLARLVVKAMSEDALANAHVIATDATGVLVQANEKCKIRLTSLTGDEPTGHTRRSEDGGRRADTTNAVPRVGPCGDQAPNDRLAMSGNRDSARREACPVLDSHAIHTFTADDSRRSRTRATSPGDSGCMKKTRSEKFAWTMVAVSGVVAALDVAAASRSTDNPCAMALAMLMVGVGLAQVIPAGLFVSLALIAGQQPRHRVWLALGATLLAAPVLLVGIVVGVGA